MNKLTITPAAADSFEFAATAKMSVKYDGIQAQWSGRNLRTRDGGIIHAPAWFTAQLPKGRPVVGELWMGRGSFQECQSTVLRHTPDARWRKVKLMVFMGKVKESANVRMVAQHKPNNVRKFAEREVALGGEGAVVVSEGVFIKVKPLYDAEAVVVGYTKGKGRNSRRVGALVVRSGKKEFRLGAGLNDEVRDNPPKVGAVVTYSYLTLTAGGIPKHAAFVRERRAA